MNVQAAPGLLCPTENNPREYITDSAPLDVADSAYYRRLLDDGSLVEANTNPPSPPCQGGTKNKTAPAPSPDKGGAGEGLGVTDGQ